MNLNDIKNYILLVSITVVTIVVTAFGKNYGDVGMVINILANLLYLVICGFIFYNSDIFGIEYVFLRALTVELLTPLCIIISLYGYFRRLSILKIPGLILLGVVVLTGLFCIDLESIIEKHKNKKDHKTYVLETD